MERSSRHFEPDLARHFREEAEAARRQRQIEALAVAVSGPMAEQGWVQEQLHPRDLAAERRVRASFGFADGTFPGLEPLLGRGSRKEARSSRADGATAVSFFSDPCYCYNERIDEILEENAVGMPTGTTDQGFITSVGTSFEFVTDRDGSRCELARTVRFQSEGNCNCDWTDEHVNWSDWNQACSRLTHDGIAVTYQPGNEIIGYRDGDSCTLLIRCTGMDGANAVSGNYVATRTLVGLCNDPDELSRDEESDPLSYPTCDGWWTPEGMPSGGIGEGIGGYVENPGTGVDIRIHPKVGPGLPWGAGSGFRLGLLGGIATLPNHNSPQPKRDPDSGDGVDPQPDQDRDDDLESCGKKYPLYTPCAELEAGRYFYLDATAACAAQRAGRATTRRQAEYGPCALQPEAWHYRCGSVYVNASACCCKCCDDRAGRPKLTERCGAC